MRTYVAGRRRVVALGLLCGLLLTAGCAADPETPAPESVPRPEWKVGDRWVFQRIALSGVVTVMTHQITEATPEGYTMRIDGLGQEIARSWSVDLHLREQAAGGTVAASFDPPAMYFAWPLTLGKAWSQDFEYRDGKNDGRYVNSWRVGTVVEPVHVLAGSFYTVRIERRGGRGERLETYWYTPKARYWVRLENSLRGYIEELVEFVLSPS